MMSAPTDLVFFFDCDNTLLDNDRVRQDLDAFLQQELGPAGAARYWAHYDRLRAALGYADYLGAVQALMAEAEGDPRLAALSSFLLDYPFEDRVYPGAFDALAHCRSLGTTAILSDGDAVFQPRKLRRSGLWNAVDGRALIYIHKEKKLDEVQRLYPARHYVMVDDKLSILTSMKKIMNGKLTTVWPRQGHYALDTDANAAYPAPDRTVERIAELVHLVFKPLAEPS